ncbi:MAG: hypothetical protein KY460_06265, partial [Actinobacteria bacterium]|nr:hypothetical protein [Actinomycetota bacterium]
RGPEGEGERQRAGGRGPEGEGERQRAGGRGPDDDTDVAIRTVERVLDLIDGFVDLNEFKHTSIHR